MVEEILSEFEAKKMLRKNSEILEMNRGNTK